ncbi:hypothetical protein EXIGLDRAFT_707453 [Exidia glandulosa HHB12029]|uniref:Uncharacterized protein n=1 Tax=Exidia glandulosa HHB12029 TaxID=1314781 RepID=A0A165JTD6_EXIGL|nr:hypothetical protein EXIGLDRAFT_707453 [Exidia glandulosa HHB12029]
MTGVYRDVMKSRTIKKASRRQAWTPSDSLGRLTKSAELEKAFQLFKFAKIAGTCRQVHSSSLKHAKVPSSGCAGSPDLAHFFWAVNGLSGSVEPSLCSVPS